MMTPSTTNDSMRTFCDSSNEFPHAPVYDLEMRYMHLIQTDIQPFFPQFAASLAEQSPYERERGRCAVVDFTNAAAIRTTSISKSGELSQFLEHAPSQVPTRRLFILEDLPCNHILTLGAYLRIPPGFFAGHWDDPGNPSTFNHRNPFQRSSRSQFRIRYATSNRVEVDAAKAASMYLFNTNAARYLHPYVPNGLVQDEARSHHAMSFWSTPKRADGSWDAVLLVDAPPTGFVRCLATKTKISLRQRLKDETSMPKRFLNPEIDVLEELPANPFDWASAYTSPQYANMFDDVLGLLPEMDISHVNLDDPISVTEIPRKLVMSTLLAFTRRRSMNLFSVGQSQLTPHYVQRNNYLSSFSEGKLATWNNDLFNFIVGSCAGMKEFSREIDENIASLGLDLKHPNSQSPIIPQWEIDGWRSIKELTKTVEDMANGFATRYLQYVTIQEAHVTNANAQSLSRITVLTMLFIPLSTVASIFSMGGDFLPGEAHMWVFWVAVIPVLGLVSYLYWQRHCHQQVVGLWRGRKKMLLPVFEVVGKKT